MKNLLNMDRYSKISRTLRLTLCILLIAMLILPFTYSSAKDTVSIDVENVVENTAVTNPLLLANAGKDTASNIITTSFNNVDVSLSQTLTKNSDGTYTIELTPQASFGIRDLSEKSTTAKYGYFQATKKGTYLFEVWGGNGGDGQNTAYSNGGKGGQGAYLNATIELNVGDIIFYTIGGNGQQSVSKDYGGGANGDGGDHGESGQYYVGGGGGYTAVYYFANGTDATSFATNYLNGKTLTTGTISESDRLSKYIMVAGGGGGGGAGNSWSTSKAVRTPDGGDGGSMTSASGKITSALVTGTYYAASNGKSSGNKQDYVGIGGSNVPGEEKSTVLGFYDGKVAND